MRMRRKNVTDAQKQRVLELLRGQLGKGHVEQVARAVHLSTSEVYKIAREERRAREVKSAQMEATEDPAQAERSGHWPGLREVARTLQTRLQEAAPLTQLVGFPRMFGLGYSDFLTLEPSGDEFKLTLAVHTHPVFLALDDHLPNDVAWAKLEGWKEAVADLKKVLNLWCLRVRGQAELLGRSWITEDQLRQGAAGLSDFFVKSLVLEVLESACSVPRASTELQIVPPIREEGWKLQWVYNSSSYMNCAAAEDQGELLALEKLYLSLKDEVGHWPELREIAQGHRHIIVLAKSVEKELERIASLATFPGRCRLYS